MLHLQAQLVAVTWPFGRYASQVPSTPTCALIRSPVRDERNFRVRFEFSGGIGRR